MGCSEVEAISVSVFVLFQLPGYQGEGKIFMFYLIMGKKLSGAIIIQFYSLQVPLFCYFLLKVQRF